MSDLTFSRTHFARINSDQNGGVIAVHNFGINLQLFLVTFSQCTTSGSVTTSIEKDSSAYDRVGNAIFFVGNNMNLSNCCFEKCQTETGLNIYSYLGGTLSCDSVSFTLAKGNVIWYHVYGTNYLERCNFSHSSMVRTALTIAYAGILEGESFLSFSDISAGSMCTFQEGAASCDPIVDHMVLNRIDSACVHVKRSGFTFTNLIAQQFSGILMTQDTSAIPKYVHLVNIMVDKSVDDSEASIQEYSTTSVFVEDLVTDWCFWGYKRFTGNRMRFSLHRVIVLQCGLLISVY